MFKAVNGRRSLRYTSRSQGEARGVKYAGPVLFLLCIVASFAWFGSLLWMDMQVRRAGELRGISVFDISYGRLLPSKYREIAKSRRLPMWPLYLYSVSLAAMFIFAAAMSYTFKK